MNYSIELRTTAVLLGTALVATLALPFVTHAQVMSQGSFCNNLDRLQTKTMSQVQARKAQYNERRTTQKDDYAERKQDRLQKMEDGRAERDVNREQQYEQLEAFAARSGNHAAVAAFRTAVESAVATRKGAVDEAVMNFEATAKELWDARKASASTFASDFEADMEALFVTARENCDDEMNPGDVRQNVRNDLTELRKQYQTRAQERTYQDELATARAELKAAHTAAQDAFRIEFNAAKVALREAFGATESNTEEDGDVEESAE